MTDAHRSETMFTLVKTLTELPGPVGHEDAVQDWLAERWATFTEPPRRTAVGNLVARVGGTGPRLLLTAHADEICLVVKSVSEDGFLHVWPYYGDTLGHPPRWFMPLNQPALVVTPTGTVEGVVATASGHVVGGRGKQTRAEHFEWNDWFVDVGTGSRAETAALGIRPGCRVIWNPPTRRIGSRHYVGKAMDDRAALAIITLAAAELAGRTDLDHEVWLAATIQEENGLIGAASLVDAQPFDRCLAVDVGLTGDIPGPDERDFPCRLGAGPILVHQDNSGHYSRRLIERLANVAATADIAVQHAVFQNYGSDGSQLLRRGVETALLTYPTRYTHSPIETVDEADLWDCVDLIVAYATDAES